MKILLALPLLLLLGVAIADEQVSTRTCTNGHCIECLNGVCRESRHKREASEDNQSSSSTCSTNNGHTVCTVCNNGACHTTSNGKREAYDYDYDYDNSSSYYNHTGYYNYTSNYTLKRAASEDSYHCGTTDGRHWCTVCGDNGCATQYDEAKREARGDGTFGTCCTTVNGHQTCRVCHDGACHTTTNGKRDVYDYDYFNGTSSNYSSSYFNYSSYNYTLKREAGEAAHNSVSSRNCDNDGCHVCENGNCRHESRGMREEYDYGSFYNSSRNYKTCNETGCSYCKGLYPNGDGCHFTPYNSSSYHNHSRYNYTLKRQTNHVSSTNCDNKGCHICENGECRYDARGKREANRNSVTSSNCDNHGCQICENGDCRYEARGKREVFDRRPSIYTTCDETGCWHCYAFFINGSGCYASQFVRHNEWKYDYFLERKGYDFKTCNETGCNYCRGVYPNGHGCNFSSHESYGKRKTNHVSSTNCDNHGCQICENGNCRYEAKGKREVPLHTTHCNKRRCIICDNDVCRYEALISKKREANHNSVTSTNCDNHGCQICENGNCRYEAKGKREAVVQSTITNCVNGHCIECVNGQCNETRNHKREQREPEEYPCNEYCFKCVKGVCEAYEE